MLSRAVAGVAGRTVVASLPGSTQGGRARRCGSCCSPCSGTSVQLVPRLSDAGALRFFASLRERLGPGEERARARGHHGRRAVGRRWCARAAGDRPPCGVRIAVNERYVEPDHVLADGDEVAFFPPVSGG